ncbi:MAG: ABC transporter permease [Acidobacteria bacterium]|nr:ABC transporter permease [Acidobacteriota bacterium]
MPKPMDSHPRKVDRFFRKLLGLYPEEFRAEYAGEMRTLAAERSRVEPMPRLLWDLTLDTVRTAPREHLAILWQDLKYAVRGLRRDRAFAAVAIASIALGIGANSSIYTLARVLMLRPLAVPDAGQVVTVQSLRTGANDPQANSHADYLDLRASAKSVTGLIAFTEGSFGVSTGPSTQPELVLGTFVSGNYFDSLRIALALGRAFRPEEDAVPGRDAVVVLGHSFWTEKLQSDPRVLGRTLRINGVEFNVIGVAPEGFFSARHLVDSAVFIPLMMSQVAGNRERPFLHSREHRVLTVKGRLAPGHDEESASAEFATLGARLEQANPALNRGRTLRVRSEFQHRVDQSPPDAMITGMLLATTALVLLIACGNLANLLLARGAGRAREFAVRLAVGANRGRLLRQLLTENLLIALAGGVAGIGAAVLFAAGLSRFEPPTEYGIKFHVPVDWSVFQFNFLLAAGSVLVFGLWPSIRVLRQDLHQRMRAGAGRGVLVAGQLAVASVLLISAAMMITGLRGNLLKDPGFRRERVLLAHIDPSHLRGDTASSREFFRIVLERLRALPGVRSATIASTVPTAASGISFARLEAEGAQLPPEEPVAEAFETVAADGYFETMGIPLLRGRWITARENEEGARFAVVNDVFAERYWPGQDPIGKRVRREGRQEWFQVIGVARRSKYIFISESPMPALYFPERQAQLSRRVLLLHTEGDAAALAAPLRNTIRGVDSDVPLAGVRTMADYHDRRTVSIVNLIVRTVTGLGVLGLLLAAVGLYGVMAYSVSRRVREIGIRMAIGASRGDVLRMILSSAARIAIPGIAAGLLLGNLATGVLQTGFVGLAVAEPVIWFAVPLLLVIVALTAAIKPALRAASTEPTVALRCE